MKSTSRPTPKAKPISEPRKPDSKPVPFRRGAPIPRLDTKKAAKFLGIAPETLRNWKSQGIGPKFVQYGRTVRYRFADLIAFGTKGGK